jgi:hypothetical protein
MSLSIPSNSTDSILCPYDNRRTSTELNVKFFIVTLTTLGFYFHLIRRRDGSYFSWSPLLYFIAPLNLVFRYVFAILGIFSFFGFVTLQDWLRDQSRSQKRWETVTTALRWLFGTVPDDEIMYSTLPTTDANPEDHESETCTTSAIGKLVMNGLFLTQCAGSIYLYNRRRQHNAVTKFDQRTFEFACAGLLVGIFNTALSFQLPIFRDPIPVGQDKTSLDRFALVCRDSCREKLLPSSKLWKGRYYLQFGKNLTISLIIWYTFPPIEFAAYLKIFLSKKGEDAGSNSPTNWVGITVAFLLISILLFWFLQVLIIDFYVEKIRKKLPDGGTGWLGLLYPVVWIMTVIAGVMLLYFIFALFFVLLGSWIAWSILAIAEVSELSASPQTVACPQLWSDPVSEWIVWLA